MKNAAAGVSSLSDITQMSSPRDLAQHRTLPVVDELAGLYTDGGISLSVIGRWITRGAYDRCYGSSGCQSC